VSTAGSSDASPGLPSVGIEEGGSGYAQRHLVVTRSVAGAARPIRIDRSQRTRAARVAALRDEWLAARSARQVVISRGYGQRACEQWIAVFTEEDKGILSVRGASWVDALERALESLGLATTARTP